MIMVIGVIGAGAINDIYLKNMLKYSDTLQVKSVAARRLENARKKADQYRIQACTVEEMLADPEIEMVVVLTPVATHDDLIRRALLAGKHVYTEKTIADTFEKAKELVKLADEKHLMLCSAPETFLSGAWQTARELVDQGTIGEIQSFVLSGNRNNEILLSLSAALRGQGGGILYDYGVYYITCLTALLGPVKRVSGICRNPYPEHTCIIPYSPEYGKPIYSDNESQVSAILTLKSGITGTMHINADSVMEDHTLFVLYGTKGILYLTCPNDFEGEVKILTSTPDPRIHMEPKAVHNYFGNTENSRGVGPVDLAEALREGRRPRADKEKALHVMEVLHAILESSRQGGVPVEIRSTMVRPEPLPRKAVPINNLGHTSFNMKNEESMIHFYRDILGMKEQFTLKFGDILKYAEDRKAEYTGDQEPTEEQKQLLEQARAIADKPWLTYFKLSDGQFIELFYDLGRNPREIGDRHAIYGYSKMNFEVDDAAALAEHITANGMELKDELHPTLDGNIEFTVLDPDGNEVQFTEYTEKAKISLMDDLSHKVCSRVNYTTQVAFDVQDEVNMAGFYEHGLGMKKVLVLTVGDLASAMAQAPNADPRQIAMMKMLEDKPWIEYYEIAPHQYLELFYSIGGQSLKEDRYLEDAYGYQHICIEVADIHKAYDAVVANGIKPETEISLGLDGAYQFWLRDPDGNRIELMEYCEGAMQLL